MTACSLLHLLILRQPFKLIFLFSGQLAMNSLGLVAKGLFQAPKYIHFFYFCKPKNVNKNTVLEIALNASCFFVDEDIKIIVFIKVQFRLLSWSAIVALFNNDSTACQFHVTQIYFEMSHADFHFLFFHLFQPKNIYLFSL